MPCASSSMLDGPGGHTIFLQSNNYVLSVKVYFTVFISITFNLISIKSKIFLINRLGLILMIMT